MPSPSPTSSSSAPTTSSESSTMPASCSARAASASSPSASARSIRPLSARLCAANVLLYQVKGAPNNLGEDLPDLGDEAFGTIGCFGHHQYPNNPWPSFK